MQKVGVDNHKLTQWKLQINEPGATPQNFVRYMRQQNQKFTDRRGKIPLRKHVNLENRQKFYLSFFCLHL